MNLKIIIENTRLTEWMESEISALCVKSMWGIMEDLQLTRGFLYSIISNYKFWNTHSKINWNFSCTVLIKPRTVHTLTHLCLWWPISGVGEFQNNNNYWIDIAQNALWNTQLFTLIILKKVSATFNNKTSNCETKKAHHYPSIEKKICGSLIFSVNASFSTCNYKSMQMLEWIEKCNGMYLTEWPSMNTWRIIDAINIEMMI